MESCEYTNSVCEWSVVAHVNFHVRFNGYVHVDVDLGVFEFASVFIDVGDVAEKEREKRQRQTKREREEKKTNDRDRQ